MLNNDSNTNIANLWRNLLKCANTSFWTTSKINFMDLLRENGQSTIKCKKRCNLDHVATN